MDSESQLSWDEMQMHEVHAVSCKRKICEQQYRPKKLKLCSLCEITFKRWISTCKQVLFEIFYYTIYHVAGATTLLEKFLFQSITDDDQSINDRLGFNTSPGDKHWCFYFLAWCLGATTLQMCNIRHWWWPIINIRTGFQNIPGGRSFDAYALSQCLARCP